MRIEAAAAAADRHLRIKRLEAGTTRTAALDALLEPLLAEVAKWPLRERDALMSYLTKKVYQIEVSRDSNG